MWDETRHQTVKQSNVAHLLLYRSGVIHTQRYSYLGLCGFVKLQSRGERLSDGSMGQVAA